MKNQSRRQFFRKVVTLSTIGGVTYFLPTKAFAKYLAHIDTLTDPYWDFDSYKDEFQEKTKRHKLDGAIQREMGSVGNIWLPGQGKNNNFDRGIQSILRGVERPMTTPVSRLNTNKGFEIRGQGTRDDNFGLVLFVKGHDNVTYAVPSCFSQLLEFKEYYCYGLPSSIAVDDSCKYCKTKYFYQQFYYAGSSPYDSVKRYSAQTHEFYCDNNGMICEQSPTGFHNDKALKKADECVCVDNLRPSIQKNSKY